MGANFDPNDWEREVIRKQPNAASSVHNMRQTMDITRNEQMMNTVLDSLRRYPAELHDRLMQLEADAMNITVDAKTGKMKNEKGEPVKKSRERMLQRRVEKLMVVRNPDLNQFPEFARKAILERA